MRDGCSMPVGLSTLSEHDNLAVWKIILYLLVKANSKYPTQKNVHFISRHGRQFKLSTSPLFLNSPTLFLYWMLAFSRHKHGHQQPDFTARLYHSFFTQVVNLHATVLSYPTLSQLMSSSLPHYILAVIFSEHPSVQSLLFDLYHNPDFLLAVDSDEDLRESLCLRDLLNLGSFHAQTTARTRQSSQVGLHNFATTLETELPREFITTPFSPWTAVVAYSIVWLSLPCATPQVTLRKDFPHCLLSAVACLVKSVFGLGNRCCGGTKIAFSRLGTCEH